MPTMSRPEADPARTLMLALLDAGENTIDDIAKRTGLDHDSIESAVQDADVFEVAELGELVTVKLTRDGTTRARAAAHEDRQP